jgi:hypothetical protein
MLASQPHLARHPPLHLGVHLLYHTHHSISSAGGYGPTLHLTSRPTTTTQLYQLPHSPRRRALNSETLSFTGSCPQCIALDSRYHHPRLQASLSVPTLSAHRRRRTAFSVAFASQHRIYFRLSNIFSAEQHHYSCLSLITKHDYAAVYACPQQW